MTDRAMERRVCAVEKRLGVTGRPLENLSDLDLLAAIEMVSQHLAAEGNEAAADSLAQHDAEEAALRTFYERADAAPGRRLVLEPDVRWPYLRANARWYEKANGSGGQRSAADEVELWQKIVASGCLESVTC